MGVPDCTQRGFPTFGLVHLQTPDPAKSSPVSCLLLTSTDPCPTGFQQLCFGTLPLNDTEIFLFLRQSPLIEYAPRQNRPALRTMSFIVKQETTYALLYHQIEEAVLRF